MRNRKLCVLLAEDHLIVREGIKRLINEQEDMEVVGEAGGGREAARLAQELRPDVVVMDVSLPEWDGMRSAQEIRKNYPEVSVVALTRHNDYRYVREMLEAGAAGFVLKQSAPGELIRAIRAVAAGESYIDPAASNRFGGKPVAEPSSEITEPKEGLTGPEEEVLRLIASGCSSREVTARLSVSLPSVEAHRASAISKLGLKSRIDVVRYATQRGWLNGR